nr:uncharacterized protein LOC112728609 [Arachis hypogaea]
MGFCTTEREAERDRGDHHRLGRRLSPSLPVASSPSLPGAAADGSSGTATEAVWSSSLPTAREEQDESFCLHCSSPLRKGRCCLCTSRVANEHGEEELCPRVRIRFAYAACSCFCFRESKPSRVLIASDFGQSEKSLVDTLGLSFACRDSIYHRTILLAFRRTLLLFLFSSSILISSSVNGYTTISHIFIYAICSQEKYQRNTPFEPNLNSLLSSIVTSSSNVSYNIFSIGRTSSSTPLLEGSIYGLYQCRGDLDPIECSKCVQNLVNQIRLICPYSLCASLQLEGCYIRYEHFDFLGKLDTSLRYKKYNKNVVSNDVEFFRRRDDVLGDLQARGNSDFRVSNPQIFYLYSNI